MGLYMAMSVCWLIGVIKPQFWLVATVSNVMFMGGLAAGRTISLFLDGIPSLIFSLGLITETLLMIWGLGNLKNISPENRIRYSCKNGIVYI